MSSPADDESAAAVTAVRAAHPDLGIVKSWGASKEAHPEWTVSEKRFRKVLSSLGGTSNASTSMPAGKVAEDELVAQTGSDKTLDIPSLAPKVKAKLFGGTKGKGLVARSKSEQGEMLWQEEPFVATPDPKIKEYCRDRTSCTHCLALWAPPPPTVVGCKDCSDAFFCNRSCMSRGSSSGSHHVLLCEGVNPGAAKLNKFMKEREWRSMDAVARISAKWRGERAWGEEGAAEAIEKRIWESMARMNMRTREEGKEDWPKRSAQVESQWRDGHAALVAASNPAPSTPGGKKFNAVLQSRAKGRKIQPLTAEEEARWFSYDAFLDLLGSVNINLEDSGGSYALHCHMNHSCEPNVQVRNLPRHWTPPTSLPAPSPDANPRGVRGTHKSTMLARRTIHPGDELTVSYVDFNLPRRARRQALRDGYGFWCVCAKCTREEKEEEAERKRSREEWEAKAAAKGEVKETKEEGKAEVDDVVAKMEESAVDDML